MIKNDLKKIRYKNAVKNVIANIIHYGLIEDIGSNDITSLLVGLDHVVQTRVVTREFCILCGISWINETFKQIDPDMELVWLFNDGDLILPNQIVFYITGRARGILAGERLALNFLQTLSGVSTKAYKYVFLASHTNVMIRDTRKTIPGLRLSQKYAVFCGGGVNHRIGLFDLFLIKENHIISFNYELYTIFDQLKLIDYTKKIEIEVEDINQLKSVMNSRVNVAMLDNFRIEEIKKAVKLASQKILLEVSGNISLDNITEIAETGIDFISIGDLTKNINAVDFSMRILW